MSRGIVRVVTEVWLHAFTLYFRPVQMGLRPRALGPTLHSIFKRGSCSRSKMEVGAIAERKARVLIWRRSLVAALGEP